MISDFIFKSNFKNACQWILPEDIIYNKRVTDIVPIIGVSNGL
jgi:hypothetical protein